MRDSLTHRGTTARRFVYLPLEPVQNFVVYKELIENLNLEADYIKSYKGDILFFVYFVIKCDGKY